MHASLLRKSTSGWEARFILFFAVLRVIAAQGTYSVSSWGYNQDGELGNGALSTTNPYGIAVPGAVSGLSGVSAIAAGSASPFAVALKQDGTVWVWGLIANGKGNDSDVPVQMSGLSNVVAVAAGKSHALALKSDGTVWGWGDNSLGELGATFNGNGTGGMVVQVVGISGVEAISAGGLFSLALKGDGTVWSWGSEANGELGNGIMSGNGNPTPTQIAGLTGIVAISAGYQHSLALKSDGTVWAWGFNQYGALGNNTVNSSAVPVQVMGLTGVTSLAGGYGYSMAILNDGSVWGWGANYDGQLGTGTTTNHSMVPVLSAIGGVKSISAGGHTLAIRNDGTVWAWGYNQYGELGNGMFSGAAANPTPAPIAGLSGASAVAAAEYFSLALTPGVGSTGQTITFGPISGQSLSASPVALTATASSGLPVTFASNSVLVCTVSGSSVTLLTAGTCSITASQPGSAAFAAAAPVTQTFAVGSSTPAVFFTGEQSLGGGVDYLQFQDGTVFGYINFVAASIFYHYDMGYEAFVPGSAADIYLYDFTTGHWWYTSTTLFPYLYDFSLSSWLYYFPDTKNPGHYTTNPRYFSNLTTGKIITQ